MFFFPSQIYLKTFYYPNFFIPTKVFRTARTPTELKQIFLHWPFFSQFCQVIEHQARRVQCFCRSFKISFLIVIGTEQNYTSASLQEDHK